MQLLIFLNCALIVIQTGLVNGEQRKGKQAEEKRSSDRVIIDNVYHEFEVLVDDIVLAKHLAVDYDRNILFYGHYIDLSLYKCMSLNLNTKKIVDVPGIFEYDADYHPALTIDQKTHVVYVKMRDRVYSYDQITNKSDIIIPKRPDLGSVYFKDVLYISIHGSLHTAVNGVLEPVENLEDAGVHNFVIDNDETFFYTNATGFYKQKKGKKDAVLYYEYVTYNVATDNKGEVYICLYDGIYKVDKDSDSLKKFAGLKHVTSFAFDPDNNIIYSDLYKVYRLKPVKVSTNTSTSINVITNTSSSKIYSVSNASVPSSSQLFLLCCCILKLLQSLVH